MSKLLIVESPTKARTIGRMLGNDYTVIASMGHIRDLPEHDFGIDIAHGFTPQYVDTVRSRPVLKSLREAAKNAEVIYLATDPDREGEAIAWHLKNALSAGKKHAPFRRIAFHEITRQAVNQAIASGGDIDQHLVDAQQARRVLDRIVGYQVSPLLWRKLGKGSSAGRVQSAALRLIVEREREIAAFTPEEYWAFTARFDSGAGTGFQSRLFKIDGADFKIGSRDAADALECAVRSGSTPHVRAVTSQQRRRNPYPPYTTSTLQQAANQLLRYSASSTMRYAQQLYEGIDLGDGNSAGLITYMRTDSVTIAKEAQVAAAEFIRGAYGPEYLPPKFNVYKNKAAAQEAHEAIRPTDVRRTPEMLADRLSPEQLKIYTLIWKRFVASQMSAARQELLTADVEITGGDDRLYTFRTTATVTVFPGFLVLAGEGKTEGKAEGKDAVAPELLRALKPDAPVTLEELIKEQKFTEPPPRFTEASLIKLLEENGVGRPSTYATILRTIQDRDYVKKEQNRLLPTDLGFTVNDFLTATLPQLFDIGFTAQMEQKLDDVETGSVAWVEMMTEFYNSFEPWLEAVKERGAPPPEKAGELLTALQKVRFDAKQKVGRRIFDDARFAASVQSKFDERHKISERQYQALLNLAAKYADQLGDPAGMSPELRRDFQNALAAAQRKSEAEQERPPEPEIDGGYPAVFAAFDAVHFAEPKPGRATFDEGKFFLSLKKQALSGKMLSEKQLAVLKRMAVRYREQLTDAEGVFQALGIADAPESSSASTGGDVPPVGELLAQLGQVKHWEPPAKKGRFTFDDRRFYQSLAKQYAEGRDLSVKQLTALKKLAAKYTQKQGDLES
ncbi:MAG: type I DNA topoisomerase [Lentisphaeria bacterium]|nr:type I DNA topoisomerase [Lentisphaeria bacterium]